MGGEGAVVRWGSGRVCVRGGGVGWGGGGRFNELMMGAGVRGGGCGWCCVELGKG